MYLASSPWWLRSLYPPGLVWRFNTGRREVFLTFDDGPVPQITPEVLQILDKYGVKATFFCVGENVEKHPEIFDMIRQKGHQIGSHTYHHAKAWDLRYQTYMTEVKRAAEITGSKLFRPPHGQISHRLARNLRKEFNIIMWTALSADYDPRLNGEQCLCNAKKYTEPGAIIVFHDSVKARDRMLYALPKYIEFCLANGYSFQVPESKTL